MASGTDGVDASASLVIKIQDHIKAAGIQLSKLFNLACLGLLLGPERFETVESDRYILLLLVHVQDVFIV